MDFELIMSILLGVVFGGVQFWLLKIGVGSVVKGKIKDVALCGAVFVPLGRTVVVRFCVARSADCVCNGYVCCADRRGDCR